MHFGALPWQEMGKLRCKSRPAAVVEYGPSGGAFRGRLGDGAFALQIEIVQKLLGMLRRAVERQEQTALLQIHVVAQRPLHFCERGIWPIPRARGLGSRQRALFCFGIEIAESFVKAPDRVVA